MARRSHARNGAVATYRGRGQFGRQVVDVVSYRRALRPVWIAAVAGAAVLAVTLVAVGTPKPAYPPGRPLTIYDPVTEHWGAVAPDLTPIGLPRALIPTGPIPTPVGIRAWRIKDTTLCSTAVIGQKPTVFIDEIITEFRLCSPTWAVPDHPLAPVTIDQRYRLADFSALAQAMAKPDTFARICPAMAIIGPQVYARTDSGWWLVQQPIDGCWPDFKLLQRIMAAHQPRD
jgi:hypothetical protein